jgi:hypothetical protein
MHVVLDPYQRITIRSYQKYDNAEAFVTSMTRSLMSGAAGRVGSLYWANGIVFRHYPYAPADSLIKEYLKGHLPLDHVDFAPMPQFKDEMRTGEFIVTILDMSNHLTLDVLSEWIAANLIKDKPKTRRQKT